MRGARAAILAADRADMDDGPATRFLQQRQEGLCADVGALEIGIEDRIPIFVGNLIEIGRLVDAGIVDEDRDRSEAARIFRGDWYYSGDVLVRDEAGLFWFKGRSDDVMKASGENWIKPAWIAEEADYAVNGHHPVEHLGGEHGEHAAPAHH